MTQGRQELQAKSDAHTDPVFAKLVSNVIGQGLCTHCGSCAGLSGGAVDMVLTGRGPLPKRQPTQGLKLPDEAYACCPGKGLDYPRLCKAVFGTLPSNWLIGCYRSAYIGYATDQAIRRGGASGGVITQILLDLMAGGEIDGAVVLEHGQPEPWLSRPAIATTMDAIRQSSQSVYIPVPVNTVLDRIERFDGRLAYVGLPDQVASLRCLQLEGNAAARKVEVVIGPYVGTSLYLDAIRSFLRANGVLELRDISHLRYREGGWPGHLEIRTHEARILRAPKFYYNYLIPSFITKSSLLSVDFTNELTDISVGDAWHRDYEQRGEGFSVVISRTERGERILERSRMKGTIALAPITIDKALSMHGHMLDFKKRGAFIRLSWRRAFGKPVPRYGYRPSNLPFTRHVVELAIGLMFLIGRTPVMKRLIEVVPLSILGPAFNTLRKWWKALSKPTKRRSLYQTVYELTEDRNTPNRC